MNSVNVKCPFCGELNRSLNMEETDGWMECDRCHTVVQLLKYAKITRVPVYQMDDIRFFAPLSRN